MAAMFDLAAISALAQVVFVNVVLSADNAVVIGMATLGVPAHQRLRALWLGIGLATVMRVGFSVVATSLLQVLGLLLAGGILLLWVAWKLWREILSQDRDAAGNMEILVLYQPPTPPRAGQMAPNSCTES